MDLREMLLGDFGKLQLFSFGGSPWEFLFVGRIFHNENLYALLIPLSISNEPVKENTIHTYRLTRKSALSSPEERILYLSAVRDVISRAEDEEVLVPETDPQVQKELQKICDQCSAEQEQ